MATDTTPAAGTGRTGITRPVLLAGIVLGTCLTILAMWNGVRLRVPDIPSILGAALGALIVWVLFMAVAAVLSELTVRHHRAALAARLAARQARRGRRRRVVPACGPGRGRQVASVAYADHHGDAGQVGRTRRACRAGAGRPARGNAARSALAAAGRSPPDGTCPTCKARREAGQPDQGTGPTYSWGPADSPSGWPADDPETAHRWARHMSTGGKP